MTKRYGLSNAWQLWRRLASADFCLARTWRIGAFLLATLLSSPLLSPPLLAATLLGEYHLEDLQWSGAAGEVRDSSAFNRNGQAIGTPLPTPDYAAPARPGKPGTCGYARFPGPAANGGALSIGSLPVNVTNGAKTSVSFWMYWDGTNSVMPIGWLRHDLWLTSNTFGFNTGNSDVFGISSAGLANRWVHVVAVFTNGSVTANALYIDGVAQALTQQLSTPSNGSAVVDPTLRIGGWQNDTSYRFSGRIDEVKVYDGALTGAEAASLFAETHTCAARLTLEWRLDECALGAVPGEVLDSSGNGNAGTPQGLANTGAGRLCKGGVFNGITPTRIKAASNFADSIENDFTIAFWVNPTATHQIDTESASGTGGTSGQNYVLYPAQGTDAWGAGHASVGVSVGTDGVSVYEHAASYMPAPLVWAGTLSGWTHVAVVYQAKKPSLYINGALARTGPTTSSYAHVHPGLRSSGGVLADNDGGVGGGHWGWFKGGIDEFRIYDGALDVAQVATIATPVARTCASCATLAHYRMEDTAWTGAPGEVQDSSVNARHGQALGTPLPALATPSPARPGNPGTCGYGSFAGGALNLPVGANTAPGAKTTVSFWMYWNGSNSVMPIGWLRHDLWLTSGAFGFNTGNSDVYGISSAGLENRWVHVSAVFVNGSVTADKLYINGVLQTLTQRLATPAVAEAVVNANLRASGWQTDAGYRFRNYLDEIDIFDGEMTQSQVLAQYNAVHACGASVTPGSFNAFETTTPPGIAGVIHTKIAALNFDLAIVALNAARTGVETAFTGDVRVELLDASNNAGALDPASGCRASWSVLPGFVPQTLSFAASDLGRKNLTLSETNAWRDVRVRMIYPATGPVQAVGCSIDNFAIRPDTLAFSASDLDAQTAGEVRPLTNTVFPGGTTHKAGRPFTIKVTGYNRIGNVTSRYDGSPSAFVTNYLLPALGACPTCTLNASGFSGAAGTVLTNTATYNEVGVIQVQMRDDTFAAVDAADGSSVGERTATSTSSPVGRFIPDHFVLSAGTVGVACASGTPPFTYMDQPFQNLSATIQAQNASDAITQNYNSPGFAGSLASVVWQAENANNGIDLSARLTVPAPSPLWALGAYTLNTPAALFRRISSPDGPFDTLQLGVRVNDPDGVLLNAPDMDATTAGPCAPCNAKAVGMPTDVRFGRLHLFNAYGPENRSLRVPVHAEYWNGIGFARNSADTCTVASAVTLNTAPSSCTLTPAVSGVGSSLSVSNPAITLAAPNARGCADVRMTTPDWLKGDWDGGGVYDDEATARATFGVFRDRVIFRREITH